MKGDIRRTTKLTTTACLCAALATGMVACDEGKNEGEAEAADTAEPENEEEGLSKGDDVVARWSASSFYEGTIESMGDDGIVVKWKDGDEPKKVEEDLVFARPTEDDAHEVSKGDFVFAKSGGTKWHAAEVLEAGDSVKLRLVRSTKERIVDPHELIPAPEDMVEDLEKQLANTEIREGAKEAGRPHRPDGWKPKAGAEVVAIWSVSKWYQGKVKSVTDGDPVVAWNDGSDPSEVEPEEIAPLPKEGAPEASKGDYVLVKPESGAVWRYAKVTGTSGEEVEVRDQRGTRRSVKSTEYILIE